MKDQIEEHFVDDAEMALLSLELLLEIHQVYCRALGFVIRKELKIEAHQTGEFLFERAGQVIETFVDRPAKCFEVGIVSIGQATAFGQLPESFNQVEIRAIRW